MTNERELVNDSGPVTITGPPVAIIETELKDLPDWTIRLKDLQPEEDLEFGDGENRQLYLFKEVLDPDENPTGLFNVFCKDQNFVDQEGEQYWLTLNGLVSKSKYVVVHMDKFIEDLVCTIPFSEKEASITHHPFIIEWENATDVQIEFFDDADAKLVFGLVTGMDSPEITSMKSVVSIDCINSYNGRRSMSIDFIIRTSANINGSSVSVKDYFTLTRKQISVTHTRRLDDLKTEIGSIQEQCNSIISRLKEYNDPEKINEIVNGITDRFLMDAKKDFSSLCENLIGDFRNLFFVLTIASYCLDSHYDITRHVGIRAYVDKVLKTVL